MQLKKLHIKETKAEKVIPIINALIDTINQQQTEIKDLQVMLSMQDEILGHQEDTYRDLKSILADFMEWTGYLKKLNLRRK